MLLGCGEGNMVLMPVSRLLLLLFVSVQCTSDNDLPDEDAAAEWENLSNTVSKDASFGHYFLGRSAPSAEFYDPPASMPVSEAETLKELFKPGGPTRPLDPRIKNMLLQAKAPPPTAAPVRPPVEALCHVDLMFLRIRKDIFSQNVRGDLRFGKCQVTLMSPEHYYFYIFLNQDCGIQKEYRRDDIIYRSNLDYTPSGMIIRTLPFSIPVYCRLPLHFQSYRLLIHPILRGRTFYKRLQSELTFELAVKDHSGNLKTTFTLSQLMQFEAKVQSAFLGSRKLYINKCYMTLSEPHNPKFHYTIIDNYGCMIEGKESSQAMFLPSASSSIQKFRMAAFVFSSGSASQNLTMHCHLALGSPIPSEVAKACTYDLRNEQWKEQHGDQYNHLCACCEHSCGQAMDNVATVSSDTLHVAMQAGLANVKHSWDNSD